MSSLYQRVPYSRATFPRPTRRWPIPPQASWRSLGRWSSPGSASFFQGDLREQTTTEKEIVDEDESYRSRARSGFDHRLHGQQPSHSGRPAQQEHPAEQCVSRRTRRISRIIAAFGASASTAASGVPAWVIGVTAASAFIAATGLSAFMDTGATGVPAYTAATVGAALPCIVIAAAGENVQESAND